MGKVDFREMARAQLIAEKQDREVEFRAKVYQEVDCLKSRIQQLEHENQGLKSKRTQSPDQDLLAQTSTHEKPADPDDYEKSARQKEKERYVTMLWEDATVAVKDKHRAYIAYVTDDEYEGPVSEYKAIIKSTAESRWRLMETNERYLALIKAQAEMSNQQDALAERDRTTFVEEEEAYVRQIHALTNKVFTFENKIINLTDDLTKSKGENKILTEGNSKLENELKELTESYERRCRTRVPNLGEQARFTNMNEKQRDSIDERLVPVEKELFTKQIKSVGNFMQQGLPANECRPVAPELLVTPYSRDRLANFQSSRYIPRRLRGCNTDAIGERVPRVPDSRPWPGLG